jgi:hypothetical protein
MGIVIAYSWGQSPDYRGIPAASRDIAIVDQLIIPIVIGGYRDSYRLFHSCAGPASCLPGLRLTRDRDRSSARFLSTGTTTSA